MDMKSGDGLPSGFSWALCKSFKVDELSRLAFSVVFPPRPFLNRAR